MASYWRNAKNEAKKRARIWGYCWVYDNPTRDMKAYWKQPYLFQESDVDALPPWVPKNATRFGSGPYIEPEPTEQELFENEIRQEIAELKRLLRP